jgi:hypothetical protein
VKLAADNHLIMKLKWSYTSAPPVCLYDMGIATCYRLDGLGIES